MKKLNEQKIEQPKVKQKEFDNKPPKPVADVPKTPKLSDKFVTIQDKNGKVKVDVNKMLDEMVKKFKPEKVEAIIEHLKNALEESKKSIDDKKPVLGETFHDLFGKSYIVIGRDKISGDKAILRRGNAQYFVDINELYEKDGQKKNIDNKLLEESETHVSF